MMFLGVRSPPGKLVAYARQIMLSRFIVANPDCMADVGRKLMDEIAMLQRRTGDLQGEWSVITSPLDYGLRDRPFAAICLQDVPRETRDGHED